MSRCEQYFAGDGCMVDQPFQPRLQDGMIRCYMVRDEVAGFGHQLIKALMPAPSGTEPAQPGPRNMYGADERAFQALKAKMESEWTLAMMRLLDVDRASLPVIWDADFLYGPKTESGEDITFCMRSMSAQYSLFRNRLQRESRKPLRPVCSLRGNPESRRKSESAKQALVLHFSKQRLMLDGLHGS